MVLARDFWKDVKELKNVICLPISILDIGPVVHHRNR